MVDVTVTLLTITLFFSLVTWLDVSVCDHIGS